VATGEPIGVDYPTLMPDLTDIADIQQAFQMYHLGIADWNGVDPPAADSIEGHLADVNERVTTLEGRPVAGGSVTPTEPTTVGTPPQAVPEGYIWVDSDDTSVSVTDFPTVIYSPTEPTGLTVADTGTIWVDEDGSAAVLNVNDYQLKTQFLPDAPSAPTTGQMWVDSDTGILYFYNGSDWQEVGGTGLDSFLLMGA
jgi:hypothetical protein